MGTSYLVGNWKTRVRVAPSFFISYVVIYKSFGVSEFTSLYMVDDIFSSDIA